MAGGAGPGARAAGGGASGGASGPEAVAWRDRKAREQRGGSGHRGGRVRWTAGPWQECGSTGQPGVGRPPWAGCPNKGWPRATFAAPADGGLDLPDSIEFVGPSPLVVAVLTPQDLHSSHETLLELTLLVHHVGIGFQIEGLPWFYLGSSQTVFIEYPLAFFFASTRDTVMVVLCSGQ